MRTKPQSPIGSAELPAPTNLGTVWVPSQRQFMLLLLAYFTFHTISRTLLSETLGVDDAEQVLLAQRWDWGYGPQPPFYTWLTMLFCGALGWSIFTMTLLKNILLFVLYASTYFITRRITRNHVVAVVATVALQFMPSISWEAERELTHSILASTMVMLTIWVFLSLKPDRWRAYLLFGVCAGFGTISKYNYAVLFAGLLLGALMLKVWRPLVLNRRMFVSLLIATAIVLPNLVWCVKYPELATASVYKLKIASAHTPFTYIKGLAAWAQTVLEQVVPVIPIFILLFWRHLKRAARPASDAERLLWCMFLATAALIAIVVCAFSVTYAHNRWMQPIMVPTTVLLAVIWAEYINPWRLKAILWLGLLSAIGIGIAANVRILMTEPLGKYEILNAPFRPLAADIKETMAKADHLFVEERWLAGNLRIWYPEKSVTIPEMTDLFAPSTNSILIWDAGLNSVNYSLDAAKKATEQDFTNALFFEEKFKYYRGTNTMRLGVMIPLPKITH